MGKMNAGNWGALLQGGVQGAETEQNMESKNLQNQYYKNAMVDPAAMANSYDTQAYQKWQQSQGQQPWQPPQGLFDPVKNKLADVYNSAKAKLSSFLPGQGQHASGPASQSTVPAPGNAAMSPPGPSSSNSASGGVPGATGPMPLSPGPTTQVSPYANGGGIPGRGGALRMRKAKPGNDAKPTKAAAAAMHPPMEKPPVDNQEMGAEGGPPRNTEAQPGSQDPMLANGGFLSARENPKPPKYQPAPNPNSVEKNEKNDSQLSRFSRVEKRFADGGDAKQPASGLEPAAAPESGWPGLFPALRDSVNYWGAKTAPLVKKAGEWNQAAGAGIEKFLTGDPNGLDPTAGTAAPPTGKATSPGQAGPTLAPADPYAQGPPAPDQDPTIKVEHGRPDSSYAGYPGPGGNTEGMQTTAPDGTPITPYNKGALADALKGSGGGGGALPARGAPAPGAPAPGAPAQQGPAAPDNTPFDFSQVQMDHRDIPDTTVKDWEDMKQGIIGGLLAHRKASSPAEAAMMADNQVSQFQHQNFMQYLQQGITLDAAGNKQGAMAALKTAYQYMPTGHGMHFGTDQQGNIVGVGYDEDNQKPVGVPVKLDQANLNHLAATYANPQNFQAENIAMMEQKRKNLETTQGQVPYMRAHAGLAGAQENYYQGRNQELLDAASMRLAAHNAAAKLPPDVSLKVNGALRSSGIMDPSDVFEATGVAAQLMQRGHSQADSTAIAGMAYAPGVDPARRQQLLEKYGLQMPGAPAAPASDMYMMGSGIPPQ